MWRKAQKSGGEGQKTVVLGCAIAYNYFQSILHDSPASSSSFAPCRTLFEIVCSVACLAQKPGELQDFLDFGRMMEEDLGKAFGQAADPAIRQVRSRLRKKWSTKHGGKKFEKRRLPAWHGYTSSKELARELGFRDTGVNQFYALSSEATHGESVVTLAAFRNQPLVVEHLTEAVPLALGMILCLQETVNSALRYGLDSDLAGAKDELQHTLAQSKP